MLNGTEYYQFTCYCFNTTPTADDLESPFFLIHGSDPLEGYARLLGSGSIRYLGDDKGLILFARNSINHG